MTLTSFIAMTTAEGIVAATVIVAVTAVVLVVIWQVFGLVRRGMDRDDQRPQPDRAANRDALEGDDSR